MFSNNFISPLSLGSANSPVGVPRQYNSDFSEKFDKSKNKLVYATIFSITVGLFSLSDAGSFLGLKLNGLTDRRLEWMAWLGAGFFFCNTAFRYFDERRVVDKYKDEVAALESEFGSILQRLRDTERDIESKLSSSGRFEEDVRRMKSRIERFKSSLHLSVDDMEKLKSNFSEFQYSLDQIKKEILVLQGRNAEALYLVKKIPARLDKFERNTKSVKEYKNIGGIRFFVFDFLTPCILFMVATSVHFSPKVEQLILDLVPQESTISE